MMKFSRAIKNLLGRKQDTITAIPAVLGDKNGIVNTGQKNYVYARVGDTVISVFNNRVNSQYGLPVMIGYDPAQPGILQVLSTRDVGNISNTQHQVPEHHENHEYPYGNDIVYMQLRQFLPLRLTPLGGFKVAIYRAFVWANGFKVVNDTLDLLQYRPTQPFAACYVLITIDENGNINVTKGNEVDISTLSLSDIPEVPATTKYVIGAIRLYASQTEIRESGTDTDILDLRYPIWHTHSGEDITDGIISANRLPVFTATEPGAVPAPGVVSNKVLRDDGTWVSAGTGDMTKAVYDTNNNGIVDTAESVPWSGVTGKPATFPPETHNHDERYYTETELNTSGAGGAVHWDNVTGKPSTYPPSAHQHAAGDVTSGTFDAARIPNLDASKITSGIFDPARVPSLDASKITAGYFGGTTAIAARVTRTSAQSIPNATWTGISFSQATFDDRPSGLSAHWSGGTPTRLTCRVAGVYIISGHISFSANSTGRRVVRIFRNDTTQIALSSVNATSTQLVHISLSALLKLSVGDYIELGAYQDSGGVLDIAYDTYSPVLSFARIA